MMGALQGHTEVPNPNYPGPGQPNVYNAGNPWMHVEKLSFRPTENLEFGFERSVIWGGKGHGPITLHTFLKSFFSLRLARVQREARPRRSRRALRRIRLLLSPALPAQMAHALQRFEVHDDVSPIDAPRRAAWRPGHLPLALSRRARLDLRVEAASTDPPVATSHGGVFMYYEAIQRQGYTNNGNLIGDWIGREGKGGQAWLTWHLSGNEWIQVNARNQKVAKDFIPAAPRSTM